MQKRTSESGFAWLPALVVVVVVVLIAILLYLFLHRHAGGQPIASKAVSAAHVAAPIKKIHKKLRHRTGTTAAGHEGFSIEGSLANQSIIKKVLPQYPDWAEEQGIMGTVKIRFDVNETGHVTSNMSIEQTTGNTKLDEVAVDALQQWEFSPGKLPGKDAPYGLITFVFGLQR